MWSCNSAGSWDCVCEWERSKLLTFPERNFPRNSSDGLAGRKDTSLVVCPNIWRGQDLGKQWEVKFGLMKAAKSNSGEDD